MIPANRTGLSVKLNTAMLLVALLPCFLSTIPGNAGESDDLMVYDGANGCWYGLSIAGGSNTVIAWARKWGWSGAQPVSGDYDGDGTNDMGVYDNALGNWYVLSGDTNVIVWAQKWGWPGAEPVPGDYDGDGKTDLAVYDGSMGLWYILDADGELIAWAVKWGWSGAEAVPADYDGDGRADLAVYGQSEGRWYITSVTGHMIAWALQWGWQGTEPVPADYDGDGSCDLGIYNLGVGDWYTYSLTNGIITWNSLWGWPGAEPVPGDYDGDGKDDFAVYDSVAGTWFIQSADGDLIAWKVQWGWSGAEPVSGNYYEPPEEPDDPYVPAAPDTDYDNFTWTLPSTASPVRLRLPTDMNNFLFGEHGGIGGYGLCDGGHIEGVSHAWIEYVPGTPAGSWGSGTVIEISLNGEEGQEQEYHIWIDYGQNLIGIHMEIETPYVSVGDTVTNRQAVGMGMSFDPCQSSGEMSVLDRGRTDGVQAWGGGSYVSVFDYLRDEDKQALVDTYKEKVIQPYLEDGTRIWGFAPQQPYLTNRLRLHEGNEGRLTGVWYLPADDWAHAYPNDILTFIAADNPYFTGNVIKAQDRSGGLGDAWAINGTYGVDHDNSRLVITNQNDMSTYYGIFEIVETNTLATLKIEYQEDSYPAGFGTNSIVYTEREY